MTDDKPQPNPGTDPVKRDSADDDIIDRLQMLGSKLETRASRNHRSPAAIGGAAAKGKAAGFAFRVIAELLIGALVGGFIGWSLDSWLATKPFLFILFLLFGMAAGFLNIIREAQNMVRAETDNLNGGDPDNPPNQQG